MLRARTAPVLALALAGGCSEDPSFSVRWKLHPYTESEPTDAPTLISVDQCTSLGITKIQVTTRNAAGSIVDEREFPCFPRGFEDTRAVAPGPEVGPGEYSVTLTALGRRGVPFCDDDEADMEEAPAGDTGTTGTTGTTTDLLDDEPPACKKVVAADAREVVIRETGEDQRVTDFIIVGVPQCSDGVDNDRDGYTDLADPSCRGDRRGAEVGDLAAAQIILRPQLMGGIASATCVGLGLRDLELVVDGPTSLTHRFPCTTTAQTLTDDLAPGEYVLSVRGIGYDGSVVAEAPLDPALAQFSLGPSAFQIVDLSADFNIVDFFEPIEAGFAFSIEYSPSPAAPPVTSCTPVDGGPVLDRLLLEVVDGAQQLVSTATLYEGVMPGPVLDGTTTLPCTDLLKVRNLLPLVWDDEAPASVAYSLRALAFPAGSDTPCYGNPDAPAPAAPNASFVITLPRLSDQGACADPAP